MKNKLDPHLLAAARSYLELKVIEIKDLKLKTACEVLLKDERFFICPAAIYKHQAYEGGLCEHTMQVMDIALYMAKSTTMLGYYYMLGDDRYTRSLDVIVAAVLWHDYGKIFDYRKKALEDQLSGEPNYGYERHRWTVRHLTRSYAEFLAAAQEAGVDEDLTEEVCHCILAHHGRNDWGSPVEPLSPEASMIHYADCMSAFYLGKPHMFRPGRVDWKDVKGS